MYITITPSDAIKLENLTSETLWREISIPFIKKNIPANNLNRPIGARCLKMLRGIAKKDKIKESTIKRGSCPALRGKIKGDKKDAYRSAKSSKKVLKEAKESKEKTRKDDIESVLARILSSNREDRDNAIASQKQAVDNILLGDKKPTRPLPDIDFNTPAFMGGDKHKDPLYYSGLERPPNNTLRFGRIGGKKARFLAREGRKRYEAFKEGRLAEYDKTIAERHGTHAQESEAIKDWLKTIEPKRHEYDSDEEQILRFQYDTDSDIAGEKAQYEAERQMDERSDRSYEPNFMGGFAGIFPPTEGVSSENVGGQFGGSGAGFNLPPQSEIWNPQEQRWVGGAESHDALFKRLMDERFRPQ